MLLSCLLTILHVSAIRDLPVPSVFPLVEPCQLHTHTISSQRLKSTIYINIATDVLGISAPQSANGFYYLILSVAASHSASARPVMAGVAELWGPEATHSKLIAPTPLRAKATSRLTKSGTRLKYQHDLPLFSHRCSRLSLSDRLFCDAVGFGIPVNILSISGCHTPECAAYFPDTPVSYPICAKDYPSINSCARAAPAQANSSAVRAYYYACPTSHSIKFSSPTTVTHITDHSQPRRLLRRDQLLSHGYLPIRFPSVLTGMHSLFPMSCLSFSLCSLRSFERTNQTAILDTPNLPSLVSSIREVCLFASLLLGSVSNTDGETTLSPTGSAAGKASTPAASAASGLSPSNTAPPRGSILSSVIAGAAALTILLGASLL